MPVDNIPVTIKAVITNPDLGRPFVEEIPFGTRTDVQNLDPDKVILSTRALSLNP